jgi:flagellar motor switch protein FliM
MEKILSQDEIDQLFKASHGPAAPKPVASSRTVRTCDFRQAGQLDQDQVRQITLLHETFAPNVANSLGAYLRVGMQANLVAVEQITFNEFLSRMPDQTYFSTLSTLPLDDVSAIQIELQLLFPMIDVLLGGAGKPMAELRDLTEIEEQILETVVGLICKEMQSTWAPTFPLEFKLGERQKQSQIVAMMRPSERVLYLSFEVVLNETHGLMNFIFPALVSNMLLRKLALQGYARRRVSSVPRSERSRDVLLDCSFDVDLRIKDVPIRIADLLNLEAGVVLPLGHSLTQPMSLCVNERAVFSGVPVSCGAKRGGLVQEKIVEPETRQGGRA